MEKDGKIQNLLRDGSEEVHLVMIIWFYENCFPKHEVEEMIDSSVLGNFQSEQ